MSSPYNQSTNSEDEESNSSHLTAAPRNPNTLLQREEITMDNSVPSRMFGTEIQKFSKDLIKSLSNFKFSEQLTDLNYTSWSQAVSELCQSIDLDPFILEEGYVSPYLSSIENDKTRFIVTTFILNHLDANNNLQTRNHLSNPADPQTLVYDPFKCWSFLKNRHAKITEAKLSAVTKSLYSINILKSDSLSEYLDRFENLIRELFLFKG